MGREGPTIWNGISFDSRLRKLLARKDFQGGSRSFLCVIIYMNIYRENNKE